MRRLDEKPRPWWPRAAIVVLALITHTLATGSEVERGRAVYNAHCYFCHGYGGDARTVAASVLDPPPRDFTSANSVQLTRRRMLEVIRNGSPGSAMQGFSTRLRDSQIEAVTAFIRDQFLEGSAANISYHSAVNGWSDNAADSPAAVFATGAQSLATPWESLTERERVGRRIFASSCVSCHARGESTDLNHSQAWRNEAVTFPEGNYVEHTDLASRPATAVFERHQRTPEVDTEMPEHPGAQLFQRNCASCHAGDGSGRNWTGSFLQPPPPDFTRPHSTVAPTVTQLIDVIANGVPATSMPGWRDVLEPAQIVHLGAYLQRTFARFKPAPHAAREDGFVLKPRSKFQESRKPSAPAATWVPTTGQSTANTSPPHMARELHGDRHN